MNHLRDQKGIAAVLGVTLVAVVLAAALVAVYAYQKHSQAGTATPTPSVANDSPSRSTTSTFSNGLVSYDYPKSWQLIESDHIQNIYNADRPYIKGSLNNPPVLSASAEADQDNGSIDAYLNRWSGSGVTVKSKSQEQIDGKPAYRVETSSAHTVVYVFTAGKRFEFENYLPTDSAAKEAFESLLKSVKFR